MTPYGALDSPPPSPPDRLRPLSLPGDDTMAMLGAPNANGEGVGISAATPTGRALSGVMKMMQGANEVESVVPGSIPPPLLQLIQQLSLTIPEIVRNMQQNSGPGAGMLSTIGMGMMGANQGSGSGSGSGSGPNAMGGGAGTPMFGEGTRNPFAAM